MAKGLERQANQSRHPQHLPSSVLMVDKVSVSSSGLHPPPRPKLHRVQLHDLLDVIRYRDFQVLQLGGDRGVLRHTAPGETASLRSALPTAPPTAQAPSAGLRRRAPALPAAHGRVVASAGRALRQRAPGGSSPLVERRHVCV